MYSCSRAFLTHLTKTATYSGRQLSVGCSFLQNVSTCIKEEGAQRNRILLPAFACSTFLLSTLTTLHDRQPPQYDITKDSHHTLSQYTITLPTLEQFQRPSLVQYTTKSQRALLVPSFGASRCLSRYFDGSVYVALEPQKPASVQELIASIFILLWNMISLTSPCLCSSEHEAESNAAGVGIAEALFAASLTKGHVVAIGLAVFSVGWR